MSADANETKSAETASQAAAASAPPTAHEAPTEQQSSRPGVPKRFAPGQTVCNEKNEKGKLCNGHLKEMRTAHTAEVHLRGDDALHKCQTCGALYMGPPLGHVRDPRKQKRFVERELTAILRAAGGTLPAYAYPNPKFPDNTDAITTARAERDAIASASKPETTTEPAAPSPATKNAAASPPATHAPADSSSEADRHRPAAEAQAATGQASAAPLSPAAATASPAAGAETPSDLAPEASTELTPGAPKDERS